MKRTLPVSWAWGRFADVAEVHANLVDPATCSNLPHIAPNHIEGKTGRLLPYSTAEADGVTSPKHAFNPGHILYSKIRPYLAKAVLVDFTGLCSADMYPIRSRIDARFLHRWLVSEEFTEAVSWNQGRTVLPKINRHALDGMPVPVPPLNEQRRIVAKIEALTAKSRRAKEALDAIPPLLDKLRQSILAAAFRGDLTAEWRAAHPEIEPASKLLERIRVERRRRWEEAELAKLKAKGEAPSDDRWKAKYQEPEPVDESELPELPKGWCWATIGQLASDLPRSIQSGPFGSDLRHEEFRSEGILAIGIDNVRDGHFSVGANHRISEQKYRELKKYAVRPGDFLITVMATVGRCCVAPDDIEHAVVTKHVYRVSVERKLVEPELLVRAYQGAPSVLAALEASVRGQTRAGINGEILRALAMPVPPISEQSELLRRVRHTFASLESVEQRLVQLDSDVLKLDATILAKAFRGELVPQDPNDEPASVLLERIRTESGVQPNANSRRRKTKTA